MSNGIKYFVTFTLGAAAGSVAAWAFLKSRYEKLAKEEIEEVREYYQSKICTTDEVGEPDQACDENCEQSTYESLAGSYTKQEGGSEMREAPKVYVITPEEFASDEDYQTESLTLYACGTLTDDFDNPIEDVEAMVGDALEHFGEYEDDSVFVRNEVYHCEYEILQDTRTFEQARNHALNLVDDDDDE